VALIGLFTQSLSNPLCSTSRPTSARAALAAPAWAPATASGWRRSATAGGTRVGHRVERSTIRRILKAPACRRSRSVRRHGRRFSRRIGAPSPARMSSRPKSGRGRASWRTARCLSSIWRLGAYRLGHGPSTLAVVGLQACPVHAGPARCRRTWRSALHTN